MKVLNKGMKGTGLYLWTIHQRGLEERKLGTIPSLFLLFILGTLHLAMGPLLAHEVHRAKAPMWPYLHEKQTKNSTEDFGRIMDYDDPKSHML